MTPEVLESDDPMIRRPGNEWRIFAKSSRFGGAGKQSCGNSAHIYCYIYRAPLARFAQSIQAIATNPITGGEIESTSREFKEKK